MGFVGYLLMGSLVYLAGFGIYRKVIRPKRQADRPVSLLMAALLLGCFLVMALVSVMIGRWLLGHDPIDWAYVAVNSAIATGVFYFGLNPDETTMTLPD